MLPDREAFGPEKMQPGNALGALAPAIELLRSSEPAAICCLLQKRHLALLCEIELDDDAAAQLFCSAAIGLGVRITRVRPSRLRCATPPEIRRTARTLSRLYDAVECQGVSIHLVRQMSAEAGIPIYEGVATSSHPTAGLAELLGPALASLEMRRLIVQAVLLSTIQ